MVGHVSASAAVLLETLPSWATLIRASNPGPMTLDGTNTWVLRAPGAPACLVVDPGPLDERHLRAVARHGPVTDILLTHAHPDHVDGLARFRELLGPPGGSAPPVSPPSVHPAGLRFERLETPGHTADSVSFLVSRPDGTEPAVCTGDTVLGRGTTIVAWPDGDLGAYLTSLDRLAALGPIPVLPGHGPALADLAAAATFYRRHRLARLDQVRSARAAGARSTAEIVETVYADVPAPLRAAAGWSVRAQLAYLEADECLEADEP